MLHPLMRTDAQVWSLGVVIWQMLTLQPVPYAETGLVAVMDGVRDGSLDLRTTLPRSAPWALLSALAFRCLDPDPTQRPSCARAMQVLDDHCHYARQPEAPARVDSNLSLSQPLLSHPVQAGVDGASTMHSPPV
jgi:serine/threonine protein kinase